jgi:hypothetical protein
MTIRSELKHDRQHLVSDVYSDKSKSLGLRRMPCKVATHKAGAIMSRGQQGYVVTARYHDPREMLRRV